MDYTDQHAKAPSTTAWMPLESFTVHGGSNTLPDTGSSGVRNASADSGSDGTVAETWRENDLLQLEMLRSEEIFTDNSKVSTTGGCRSHEIYFEQEDAVHGSTDTVSATKIATAKGGLPSRPDVSEGISDEHWEFVLCPDQTEDFESANGEHEITDARSLSGGSMSESQAEEEVYYKEDEDENVDQDSYGNNEDKSENGIPKYDTEEPGKSVLDHYANEQSDHLQAQDGEGDIANADGTRELHKDCASFQTETGLRNLIYPGRETQQNEVCKPALEYFAVQWGRRKKSQGLPRQRNQITRRRGITPAQVAPWYDLHPLTTTEFMGGTYSCGDDVYIYTSECDFTPARIHEIRVLGDGRKVISVLWYYSKQETEAMVDNLASWPVGATHILTNWRTGQS